MTTDEQGHPLKINAGCPSERGTVCNHALKLWPSGMAGVGVPHCPMCNTTFADEGQFVSNNDHHTPQQEEAA